MTMKEESNTQHREPDANTSESRSEPRTASNYAMPEMSHAQEVVTGRKLPGRSCGPPKRFLFE